MAEQAAVAEQFQQPEQQREAATLGMWIFLATEVLFFGVLFTGYLIGRVLYPEAFAAASRETELVLGTANTVALLTSGLTMALAVRAAQADRRRALVLLLLVTALIGLAFLGIKGYEYWKDYQHHLVPGLNFRFEGAHPERVELFFLLYFFMTGLHAIHLSLGIGTVLVMTVLSARGHFGSRYFTPVKLTGLYWHFVDTVWIFLYPLLYLVSRS